MAHFQVCYKYYGLLLVLLFLCMFIPCMDWEDGRVTERCTLCAENMSYCQCFDSTVSHPGLFNVNSCCNCTEYLAVKKTNKKTPANTSDWYNENCCAGYLAVKKTKMKMSPTSSRNGHNEKSSTKHLAVKKTNMKTPAASISDGYNENSTASCQDDSNLNKGEVKSEAIVSSTQWMCCCLVAFGALFVSLFIVLYKKLKQQTTSTKENEKMKDCYISYSDPAPSDFLLDEISPLTKASSRLMGIKLKKHNERGTLSDLDHLFEFRRDSCFRQTCTACPALSLASHFASGTFGQPVSTVELHKEGVRLATFKDFPTNVLISAIRLAQTGFYYTMERDIVKCFSCGVTHQGWQAGDRPALIHARISPSCNFVRGCDSSNLSLPLHYTNPPSVQGSSSMDSGYGSHSSSGVSSGFSSGSNGNPSGGSGYPDVQMDSAPANVRDSMSLNSSGPQALGAPSAQSASSTAEGAPAEPATTSAPSSQPSPGTSSLQAVSEGPVTSSTTTTTSSSSTAPASLPSRRLDLAGSVYPLYSQMDARRRSYDKWPQVQDLPKVDELISLGFFYAGYADCVRCFFCGIGLKSWEPGDIPAEVHARWRPTCEYLRLVKGDQFVDRIASGGRNVSSGETGNGSSNTGSNSSQARGVPSASSIPDTPVVDGARESGYTDQQIAEAIGRLRTIGMEGAMDVMLVEVLTNIFGASTSLSPSAGRGSETTQPSPAAEGNPQAPNAGESRAPAPAENAPNVLVADNANRQALENRRQELLQENARLRDMRTCQRCHGSPVGVIFLPCGHIIACTTCAPNIRRCLRCDTVIRATANVFFS